ncbi:MAG: acyl-CoA synthetase, partial [Candidatus Tectomicrobia bacterium]|nr:acyl-CoA synthetase [Candidatus Tectomicrobia bacterium]
DTAKTASAYHDSLFTIGDIGYLAAEGYLFLTDRQSHMIISGGVNIYPAEVESTLILHPAVRDVAVIGVPDVDMGEQVKAVVELREGYDASLDLAQELIAFARDRIAHYKCPRSVDFIAQLPRSAAGKLLKHALRGT